jgi:hypothetical protein
VVGWLKGPPPWSGISSSVDIDRRDDGETDQVTSKSICNEIVPRDYFATHRPTTRNLRAALCTGAELAFPAVAMMGDQVAPLFRISIPWGATHVCRACVTWHHVLLLTELAIPVLAASIVWSDLTV